MSPRTSGSSIPVNSLFASAIRARTRRSTPTSTCISQSLVDGSLIQFFLFARILPISRGTIHVEPLLPSCCSLLCRSRFVSCPNRAASAVGRHLGHCSHGGRRWLQRPSLQRHDPARDCPHFS